MLVKYGKDTSRLETSITSMIPTIDHVYRAVNVDPVITSTYDGQHMEGSLHYTHRAIDLRLPSQSNHLLISDEYVYERLAKILGEDYDVVLETDHIHVEYDPKNTHNL